MKPNESQFEDYESSGPEWFYRPLTHEDMLEEAARREDEKNFPKLETASKPDPFLEEAAKKGKPPF